MNKLARDDEEGLIARSQQGDVQAFNQLVLRYQSLLFGAVFRLLGDYDTAADVTQDAFLAAFRGIASYRGGSSFRAWLLRIGSNMACDHWRRVQRHPAMSLDVLTEADEPQSSEVLSALATSSTEEGDPEAQLLSQELQELIQRGIERLPLEQRIALVLCDIEGLSYEEVAATTQTTLGTVRSRIARGREKLRTYLSQYKELLPRNYRLSTKTSDD